MLREQKDQSSVIYLAKLSLIIEGDTKVFHDKIKFKQHICINQDIQRITERKLQNKEGNYTQEKARN